MKYTKKPVTIDAFRWTGGPDQEEDPEWIVEAITAGSVRHDTKSGRLEIDTLEGTHHATPGDFIIRGVKGELYPCKPDIFAMTYSPAALADAPSAGRPMTWTREAEAVVQKAQRLVDHATRIMHGSDDYIRFDVKRFRDLCKALEALHASETSASESVSEANRPESSSPTPILERSDTAPSLSGSVEIYPGGPIQGASGAQTVHTIGTQVNPDTPSHLTGEAKADPGQEASDA